MHIAVFIFLLEMYIQNEVIQVLLLEMLKCLYSTFLTSMGYFIFDEEKSRRAQKSPLLWEEYSGCKQ